MRGLKKIMQKNKDSYVLIMHGVEVDPGLACFATALLISLYTALAKSLEDGNKYFLTEVNKLGETADSKELEKLEKSLIGNIEKCFKLDWLSPDNVKYLLDKGQEHHIRCETARDLSNSG